MKKYLTIALLLFSLFSLPAHAQAIIGSPIAGIHSSSAESGHILKSSAGYLYGIEATSGASIGYVMIFDSATVPADGTVSPMLCYQMPATSSFGVSFVQYPLIFNTGISVAFSTTGCYTKTASATAYFSAQVR